MRILYNKLSCQLFVRKNPASGTSNFYLNTGKYQVWSQTNFYRKFFKREANDLPPMVEIISILYYLCYQNNKHNRDMQ